MKVGAKVELTRDFPRLKAKVGDKAEVVDLKGDAGQYFEIALFPQGSEYTRLSREQYNVVVIPEWIKETK